ncbi:ABC transporter substrate-binding protein [Aquibacillus salsiterrae]|uniref:ABC transporter substrate-binding protein n=1 Tax=Aquibacillus salsiterrae TaxID=2950439 RepID=A0A9X3WF81_9BACI|nr:ABC transporter substrate-binding protein [Aquibacillus salsiterrae]MDC3417573.1 ABC transporter substrate-binding protein [Aquibacillus salsiterrae]
MKFMKSKLAIFLLIVLTFGLLLVGCSGGDSETGSSDGNTNDDTNASEKDKESASGDEQVNIRFAWWTNPNRTEVTKAAIDLFEEKYPNIKVTAEYYSWDSYWQKMATVAAGGSLPDVMQMDGSRLKSFVEKEQLLDLGTTDIDTSGIGENTLELGKVDGKQYALTTSINAQILISNPEILEEAGVSIPEENYTWEDYADMLVKIYEETGKYGAANEMEQPAYLDYWARTKGENLYSEDGKTIGMSKETLTSWFQYWLDLQEKGGVPTAEENSAYAHNDMSASPFIAGETAFNWLFLGTGGQYETALNKPIKRLLLPEYGNDNKPYPLHAAMFWTAAANTEYPEEAAKLIDFLENDPEVSKLFENDRGIPANSENMQLVAESTDNDTVRRQNEVMAKVEEVATPLDLDPPNANGTADILKDIAQQVTFKQLTPSEAADEFTDQLNQSLSK